MAQTIHISGSSGGTVQIGGGTGRHAEIKVSGGTGPPVEKYAGPYEFTPAEETQTVTINGKQATQDITINPIPSNYGRVSYNGRVITIT